VGNCSQTARSLRTTVVRTARPRRTDFTSNRGGDFLKEEQQRVAVVDPRMRISFIFARCRYLPTRPRYAAAAAAAAAYTAALVNLLIKN